jgi:hypothetical protein
MVVKARGDSWEQEPSGSHKCAFAAGEALASRVVLRWRREVLKDACLMALLHGRIKQLAGGWCRSGPEPRTNFFHLIAFGHSCLMRS